MKNLFLLFMLGLFCVACNSTTQLANDPKPTPKDIVITDKPDDSISDLDDDPLFYLHRESCRGHCPGYTFTIFESGKVDYFGQRKVERIGNHIAVMSANQVTELKKEANKIGFENFDAEYIDKNIMDLPSFTIRYKEKSVLYTDMKGPESLKNFSSTLDAAIETLQWEKVD